MRERTSGEMREGGERRDKDKERAGGTKQEGEMRERTSGEMREGGETRTRRERAVQNKRGR